MKKVLSIILTAVMLCSIFALPAMADTETDNRVWFDLNGNVRLFVKSDEEAYTSRTTYKEYLPGGDFAGFVAAPTGDFATDQAAVVSPKYGGAMFVYTIGKNTAGKQYNIPDFSTGTDGDNYWTINDVSYRVEPSKNAIKVTNRTIDTSAVSESTILTETQKSEMIAKYQSINNGVTMDIEDGKYKNIGILAGITAGYSRNATITLVYSDANEEKTITITTDKASETTSYLTGTVYFKNFTNTGDGGANSNGGTGFIPIAIETDPTKTLTAVKINGSGTENTDRCVYVVSAWGVKASISDYVSAIEKIMTDGITDTDECDLVRKYIEAINEDGNELTADQQTVCDSALAAVTEYEANIEKNKAINNKYTQLEFVGPWDMFATGDDITDANWKVTSTAAAPNILAYKGFNQSNSGNTQPSASNNYAFRADMIDGTAVEKNEEDGRYYINVGSVPFKLGEIKTVAGERGTNGWIPRGKLDISAYTEGAIPDIATTGDVTFQYGGSNYATNVMKGTFAINKTNIGAINFLTTGVFYGTTFNRLYDVYVKYEGEETEEHGFMLAGNLSQQADEAVFAIPAKTYNDEIVSNDALAPTMKAFTEYTVDEINALRGYTPTTTVDTSKVITSNNYTLEELNEALGLSLKNFPKNWIKDTYKENNVTITNDTTINDLYKEIVAGTKYKAMVDAGVTLASLNAGLDTTKLASAYEGTTVALPTESTSFVNYKRGNYTGTYSTVVSSTKYPLNSSKKVESVRVEGNMTEIKGENGLALGSGGFYNVGEYNVGNGVMMLTYNGERVVNINGTDYVLFMKVQRECADSMFLGATYERKATIKEDINRINKAIAVIDENTKVAEIVALREEIEALKIESTYVTDADFDLETLVAAETTLSSRKITEATEAMTAITPSSTIEEANAAKDLYDYALLDENVTEESFDSNIVALFNQIHAQIADKTNLKGVLNVRYFKGEKPSAEVIIENTTKFAGKPYKIVLAYYDAEQRLLGTYVENKESVKDEKVSFTVNADKDFEGAVKVKGFIWKDFATLIPLSDADETTKKEAFKVLSIGNSFSNNAHTYLAHIAADAGFEKVQIANLFIGGCTLETHHKNLSGDAAYTYQYRELNADGTVKSASLEEKVSMLYGIKANDWDVITIQQGSTYSGKADSYSPYLAEIIDYVNANKTNTNAKIAWHTTWAYLDGSDALADRYNGMTQIQMYNAIIGAVKEQVLPLDTIDFEIPAGTAIQNLRATSMGDTFNSDDIHLNTTGCYVAGLTWFAKITGMSIDDITYAPNDTVKDNLDLIKTAVKNAIANPYQVTK